MIRDHVVEAIFRTKVLYIGQSRSARDEATGRTGIPQLVLIPAPVTSSILCEPAKESAIS
jgi:hypothetical protein